MTLERHTMSNPWHQVNIAFPDWSDAERTAVVHLSPLLADAENNSLLTGWFFIRKAPCWRLRYQATHRAAADHFQQRLGDLERACLITRTATAIYEPETHAFGGTPAISLAHRLWHLDSRHLLTYLATPTAAAGRRELSILLCSAMLRAARLDWYEQGDVWAQVAEHRDPPHHGDTPADAVRRLISTDTDTLTGPGKPLAFAAEWAAVYTTAGRELADLASNGHLHRGLRAVLAHHIVFAWNRLGLSTGTQAALATAAGIAVFGPDPTHTRHGASMVPAESPRTRALAKENR